MTPSFARCARLSGGAAVFAAFVACGGVSDPDLFSPGSSAGAAGSSSHAGAPASGAGAPASGGASAAGGASNTGGDSSAAGAGSSEGGEENGGSSAAGSSGAAQAGAGNGAGASVGGSANGGASNGGSAGSQPNAGSAGSDDETCQTLFAKANQQLAAAQVCNLAADAMQCTGTVKNLCKCEVPVNREESAESKAYQATLAQLDNKKCSQVCAAIACFPATHATCRANTFGSTAGTCTVSYAQPL